LGDSELFAIRYATRDARRSDHFIGGDPHDGPMPMDYFMWLARGGGPHLRHRHRLQRGSREQAVNPPRVASLIHGSLNLPMMDQLPDLQI
jgi:hypothetical protein